MKSLKLAALLVASLIIGGCASTTAMQKARRDLYFEKKTSGTIEVQIFGISSMEDSYWRKVVKPDEFWSPASATRKEVSNPKTIEFGKSNTYLLSKKDPIWDVWLRSGVRELVIFANLPGVHPNDENDPRRVIVLLDRKQTETLRIEVLTSYLRVFVPQQ